MLKRCVDLTDLLASATTGQVDVAVVSGELPGLDADAVMQLLRHDVRTVAVGGDEATLTRIGIIAVVDALDLDSLPETVSSAGARELVADPEPVEESTGTPGTRGRIIAVHGPAGAPGRTTLAIGLAAEHGHRGRPTLLVDADPYGGAVAQHLGVLDEVSGLLAAARLVNAGTLDAESFARCRRVLTEASRCSRGCPGRTVGWRLAREFSTSCSTARSEIGDVVVDTGFSLEDDADLGRNLSRNQLTLDAVAAADQVVVVGSAEPTGLARLARTLVELREVSDAPVTVVVNRMRDSLGWSKRDIVGMVEGYTRAAGVHFLPEDRATTDRAMVAGKAVLELGDSPLRRGIAEIHDAVFAGRVAQAPPISR